MPGGHLLRLRSHNLHPVWCGQVLIGTTHLELRLLQHRHLRSAQHAGPHFLLSLSHLHVCARGRPDRLPGLWSRPVPARPGTGLPVCVSHCESIFALIVWLFGWLQAACINCPIGTFWNRANVVDNVTGIKRLEVLCTPCPAGSYNPSEAASSCLLCDPGSSTDGAIGSSICPLCGDGRVAPCNGTSVCQVCDLLSMPDAVRVSCICKAGYYADGSQCRDCPVGGNCSQPGTTAAALPIAKGYWRSSDNSSEFQKCMLQSVCLGGTHCDLIDCV